MRKAEFVIGAVAFAMLIQVPALAADMAIKAPPLPTPIGAHSDWTGFYLDADAAWQWQTINWADNSIWYCRKAQADFWGKKHKGLISQ